MQCFGSAMIFNALDSIERATTMSRFGPPFPAFDVWEKMSESEQDALIARMERSRRRSDVLAGILIAMLLVCATGGALYLASTV